MRHSPCRLLNGPSTSSMVTRRGGSSVLRVVKVDENGPFDSERLATSPPGSRDRTELAVQPGRNCG